MRALLIAAVFVLAPFAAQAQPRLALPSGVEAKEAALLPSLSPRARAFVKNEGKVQASLPQPSAASAKAAARAALGPDFEQADINALIMLVMMEAARTNEAELRGQMAQMRAVNAQKKAQREKLAGMKTEQAGSKAAMAQEYKTLPASRPGGLAPCAPPGCPKPGNETLANGVNSAKLDSLNDSSEMEQMRLQQEVDRRQKAQETLSNLIKSLSDTSGSITGNLK